MSTVSGEESVRPNLAPRQGWPGHRGRRLVLTCELEHRVPRHLHVQMIPFYARCPQCGSYRRKWTWMPAPLWLDGWDWLIWGARAAGRCLAGLGRLL